jgi:hypothetical protein
MQQQERRDKRVLKDAADKVRKNAKDEVENMRAQTIKKANEEVDILMLGGLDENMKKQKGKKRDRHIIMIEVLPQMGQCTMVWNARRSRRKNKAKLLVEEIVGSMTPHLTNMWVVRFAPTRVTEAAPDLVCLPGDLAFDRLRTIMIEVLPQMGQCMMVWNA